MDVAGALVLIQTTKANCFAQRSSARSVRGAVNSAVYDVRNCCGGLCALLVKQHQHLPLECMAGGTMRR